MGSLDEMYAPCCMHRAELLGIQAGSLMLFFSRQKCYLSMGFMQGFLLIICTKSPDDIA